MTDPVDEALADRTKQPLETFAHVAGLNRHEHFEAAGKTQHGFSSARTNAAASATWLVSRISNRAPPGNWTCKAELSGAGPTTTSNKRTAGPGRFLRR